MTPKRIVVTSGEPAGIGPDLCVKLAQKQFENQIIVAVDPDVLSQRAKQLEQSITLVEWQQQSTVLAKGSLYVLPVKAKQTVSSGKLSVVNSEYVLDMLSLATECCLHKQFDALVTAPVHKAVINDAGIAFSGHTEYLAEKSQVEKVVMMLATSGLRVALATTHLPLMKVSEAISQSSLEKVINITHTSLEQQFGIQQPHIAICGLNPHAGEGGHMGMEEVDTIIPVIKKLQLAGMRLSGPWPADTIFNQDKLSDYDAVLAMYHDQGLPVLKHYAFGKAVNVTLGLPFIRTSVDHGTALDLAGTGKASEASLVCAIEMASEMMARREGLR